MITAPRRPARRLARFAFAAALTPLLLTACTAPAPQSPSVSKSAGSIEKPLPKFKGSIEKPDAP
ncbi:hypothetical protein [Arthrobacter sp. IK3]|uniref:hypothetical protein n=1 Tax=Arthrobacter sp. IK3 TaxID=3448169 RepID=UPI003EE1F739